MPVRSRDNRGFFVDWQLDLTHAVDMVEVFGGPQVNLRLESLENEHAEHVIYIHGHEAGLGTRKGAAQLRVLPINMLNLGAPYLVLDFERVAVVGPSFADEVLGKLVEEFGVVEFMQRFQMRNMTHTIELFINRAIGRRIATEPPVAITRGSSQF